MKSPEWMELTNGSAVPENALPLIVLPVELAEPDILPGADEADELPELWTPDVGVLRVVEEPAPLPERELSVPAEEAPLVVLLYGRVLLVPVPVALELPVLPEVLLPEVWAISAPLASTLVTEIKET